MLKVLAASASHVGRIRDNNQDRAMHASTLGAVADGMGGHAGGEKAAAMAIAELNDVHGAVSERRLIDVVEAANRRIYEAGAEPELRGMGTTIVAAGFDPASGVVTIVNVGDSRGYLFRDGELRQVTVDHSLVGDLVRGGRLTAEEALVHPQRNIVTRALGIAPDVDVDAFAVHVQADDRLLLASDGLSNEVPEEVIADFLADCAEPEAVADALIEAALAGGGRDNVTVVVMDFVDDGREPPTDEIERVGQDNRTVADPLGDGARPRRRRLPLRGLLLIIAIVVVLTVAGFGTAWYAGNGFFADGHQDVVAIYRGRPGGVLWFKPELVEEHPELRLDELDGASRQRLDQRPVWSSLEDAREFVENFEQSPAGN